MNLQTVNLRDPGLTIPCPTRKRNIVDGDVVDLELPYWARIFAERDIVLASDTPAPAAKKASKE